MNISKTASLISCFIIMLLLLSSGPTAAATNPGDIKWQQNFPKANFEVESPPAIANDGTVYLVAPSTTNTSKQSLYSIAADGSINWENQYSNFDRRMLLVPSIGPNKTIYVGGKSSGEYYLHAFKPSGKIKWKVNVPSFIDFQSIGPDGTIYFGVPFSDNNGRVLYAISPDGNIKWTYSKDLDFGAGGLSVGPEGNLYRPSFGPPKLTSFSDDGQKRWEYPVPDYFESRPVISSDGTIYFINGEPSLVALSSDGTLKWKFGLNGPVGAAGYIDSSFVLTDKGRILISESGGSLLLNSDGTVEKSSQVSFSHYALGKDRTVFGLGSEIFAFDDITFSRSTFKWSDNLENETKKIGIQNNTLYHRDGNQLIARRTTSQHLMQSAWSTWGSDNKNTFRAGSGQSCTLKPNLKVRPKRININPGVMTVFVQGFEESKTDLASIDPSTVTINGTKPERWNLTPQFLKLKYRRNKLGIKPEGKKWSEEQLTVKGSLKSSGCFEVSHTVKVRP